MIVSTILSSVTGFHRRHSHDGRHVDLKVSRRSVGAEESSTLLDRMSPVHPDLKMLYRKRKLMILPIIRGAEYLTTNM